MKLGQAYYREKEISDKVHLKQTLQENRDALLRQMKERQDLISKEQEQDKIYGLSLAERKRRAEMHEIQDRLRSKEKQKDYHIALKSQIEVKLSERQQFDRIKEEFKKLNISSQDISQKSPYPMIKEPRSKFSPNYRAASENKYGQPMNYSLPSERNVTPGRDKFLAHYGSNILHN